VAPLFAALDTIDASDPAMVRIQTKSPVGTLLSSLSLVRVAPAAKLNADGFWTKPIGKGPFRAVSWQPDAEFRLEANPDYWGPPPGVKNLTFRDIRELAARVTAIDTGEIDVTFALPPDQIAGLKQNQDLKVDQTKTFSYYFIWFNHSKEPFTDKRVRQALWYALDIDSIVKDLFSGLGQRAQAPIPSTVFGFAAQTPYAYDPDKAKQLLSDAGHPTGIDVDMIWNPGSGPQDRELAQAVLSAWNKVGVRVKSREEERGIWLQDLLALNWDIDLQTNAVTTGDADFTLRRLYHSSAKRLGYANPDLDKILDDAVATLDQQRRQQLYAQANKILWDDAAGIFPMELLTNWVQRKQLSGFTPPANEIADFSSVRLS
jgi:peptide/nickel transport system substrate-binding protein